MTSLRASVDVTADTTALCISRLYKSYKSKPSIHYAPCTHPLLKIVARSDLISTSDLKESTSQAGLHQLDYLESTLYDAECLSRSSSASTYTIQRSLVTNEVNSL